MTLFQAVYRKTGDALRRQPTSLVQCALFKTYWQFLEKPPRPLVPKGSLGTQGQGPKEPDGGPGDPGRTGAKEPKVAQMGQGTFLERSGWWVTALH